MKKLYVLAIFSGIVCSAIFGMKTPKNSTVLDEIPMDLKPLRVQLTALIQAAESAGPMPIRDWPVRPIAISDGDDSPTICDTFSAEESSDESIETQFPMSPMSNSEEITKKSKKTSVALSRSCTLEAYDDVEEFLLNNKTRKPRKHKSKGKHGASKGEKHTSKKNQ